MYLQTVVDRQSEYQLMNMPGTRKSQGSGMHDFWIINYDARRALHNYRFFSVTDGSPPRIHVSRDCGAIIISNLPLAAIHEPHVMAWRHSFYEISRETLVIRAAAVANGRREHVGGDPEPAQLDVAS